MNACSDMRQCVGQFLSGVSGHQMDVHFIAVNKPSDSTQILNKLVLCSCLLRGTLEITIRPTPDEGIVTNNWDE